MEEKAAWKKRKGIGNQFFYFIIFPKAQEIAQAFAQGPTYKGTL